MARRNRNKKNKRGSKNAQGDRQDGTPSSTKNEQKKTKISFEDIQAMSDSDGDDNGIDDVSSNAKAMQLKRAIESGKFDALLEGKTGSASRDKDDDKDDSDFEMEEVTMDDDDDDNDENLDGDADNEQEGTKNEDESGLAEKVVQNKENSGSLESKTSGQDNDETELDQSEEARKAREFLAKSPGNEHDGEDNSSDDSGDENETNSIAHRNTLTAKAMSIVTKELQSEKTGMPWPETFDVVSKDPLPFGENGDDDANPLDIHDDLKREVAFYDMALEAVKVARGKCREAKIPFSRPDDFFAEMVKTDEHMARVKDRLIFETKKIEAVAQRRSNKEQKLRRKESHANKLAEKAKRQRQHFRDVDDWAKSAAQNRGGTLDDDADNNFLRRMDRPVNKKREAADRKYGFGGKRGRFKQNDRATLNDTSSFNPRGNFGGIGTKRTSSASASKRKGKRARDASRSRRS